MKVRVVHAAVLGAMCAATMSCGGGILPGDHSPPVTATPDGTAAHPYTADWLDHKLLTAENLSGDKVVKANCQPKHVDAGGAGEYDCVVTMDNGHKVEIGYEVSSGIETPLGPGIELN